MFDLERVFTHKIRAEFLNYLINSFQIGPARRLADTGQAVISGDLYEMAIAREYGFNFFDFHFKLGYFWMYKSGICDLQNFLQQIGFSFEPSMIFRKRIDRATRDIFVRYIYINKQCRQLQIYSPAIVMVWAFVSLYGY